MNYRSNLPQPDLTGFVLRDPPKQMLGGHDGPSDRDFEPECTYWTHDEGAILYAVTKTLTKRFPGEWVDIGARFGWTAANIIEAGGTACAVDPHLALQVRQDRFEANLSKWWNGITCASHAMAAEFFAVEREIGNLYGGFVIDGNHDFPEPLNDAKGCLSVAQPDCVIFFHDFWGRPVQDGVTFLQTRGFRTRIYNTPNGVALCWRGFDGWEPPDHVPDPAVDWAGMRARVEEFDWSKCE